MKKQVLADVEAVVTPDAVLATNTSSLSVSAMAADLAHPSGSSASISSTRSRCCRCSRSSAPSTPTTRRWQPRSRSARQLKKSCVLVRDAPGFVVNRLLARYLGEVLAAMDEGTPIEEADRALDPLGLPMSPMTLLALVGPAVALHTAETMHAAFPDRFSVSENARRLVESGKSGVYLWDGGTPTVDPEVRAIFEAGRRPEHRDQVRERALAALASEIRIMLDEGVVAAPQDIDLCLISGRGLAVPPGRGHAVPRPFRGVRAGTGARFLPPGVASVPA